MTLSNKDLLVFIFATILHFPALSQGDASAQSLYDTGEVLFSKNREKAFEVFQRSMNLSRQAKDWELYLRSINKLASPEFKGSEERQKQIFLLLKEGVEIFKGSKENDAIARLHFNVAEFYNKVTVEIEAPIYHYEIAKRIWTNLKGQWSEEVSNCYHGLGNIYKYYKFDFHEAEKCYEKALLIREKIQFRDSVELYKNYYSLAATNRSQRDFEKALSYGTKTLTIAEKLGTDRLEMANGIVANIYRDIGGFSLAKKHYLTALSLNEKTKDMERRAWYYLCLGETFNKDSLSAEALQYFKKAYVLFTTAKAKDDVLFIRLLIKMMETYSLNKDDGNFTAAIRESLQQLRSLGKLHSREAAEVWMIIGDHHGRKAKYDSAIFYYQKALTASVTSFKSADIFSNPTEDAIGNAYYVSEALAKKASVLRAKFSENGSAEFLTQSLACLRLAEKLLSKQRNTLDMEEAKWEFLEENYDLYENIIEGLYKGRGTIQRDSVNHLAFKYFEQSKSRSLADALVQTEQAGKIINQDTLFRLHAELKRKLLGVQDLINRGLEEGHDSGNIRRLRDEVIGLDQRIQSSKFAIEEKYPGYFNVKYGYRTVPLDEIQKVMKEKDQILLEYFWGNKSVYALGISSERIVFHRIGSPDSIKTIVNNLLLHLSDEHSSMNVNLFQLFTSNAHQLFKILVEPFVPLMSGGKRVQIIPDGSISQVPFEILLEENSVNGRVDYRSLKYLIKAYTIGYAYSSSMLVQKLLQRRIVNPKLLAIGFTGGQRLRASDPELDVLEGAEDELKTLEERFNEGKFLLGKEATESNFKTLAPDFDIIHLAIHGMGDVKKNFAASLYFRSKYDSMNDGELHAYELYGLKLKALLAVLSSCESGLGRVIKAKG